MEDITVQIGSVFHHSMGDQGTLRDVAFRGEKLGQYRRRYGDRDDRGCHYTLYRTEDGRYIVHIYDWSRWQGESDTYALREVTESELFQDDDLLELARDAGLKVPPMTLDEALAWQKRGEE